MAGSGREQVKHDLNRRAKPEEPLPDLVTNGYYLLGHDWRETAREWTENGAVTPPVMITVANRTETAARIKHAFDRKRIRIDELCDPERTLHIDSKVLAAAEAALPTGPSTLRVSRPDRFPGTGSRSRNRTVWRSESRRPE